MNNAHTPNTFTGPGDRKVAFDLYCSAILQEATAMRRAGTYVCLSNILARLPSYNAQILTDAFWSLAIGGQL